MMTTARRTLTAASLCAALLLSACMTDPDTGQQRLSKGGQGALIGASGGAILGAILGGRNNRAETIIGAGLGAIAGGAMGSYMDRQEGELRRRTAGTGIAVERQGTEIAIKFPSGISFDTGETRIKPEMRPALDQVAATLASYQSTSVDVTGHSDASGVEEANRALSEQRANAVADYLEYRGVARARVATRGYGSQFPLASNDTPEGRAQNRRVEIRLSPVAQADLKPRSLPAPPPPAPR